MFGRANPTETVSVSVPGKGTHQARVTVRPDADDDEIGIQMSKNAVPGTVINVTGSKYGVVAPGLVVPLDPDRIQALLDGRPFEKVLRMRRDPREPSTWEGYPPIIEEPIPKKKPQKTFRKVSVKPKVGDVWVSKDKRRAQTPFKIKRIYRGIVHADDGREIKLERIRHYKRIVHDGN